MSTRDNGDQGEVSPTATRQFSIRLVAGCALLVGIAFIQSSGYLISETKFDLVANPLDMVARAFGLWDDNGAFGQLQNQAYGYLWPMGPFFALGWLVDLPGWVVQRLWLALVMCVAFTGAAKVARALGVRSDLACLVAAFAYATSPRFLSTLGPISIEAWPSALAPWVLLPLVLGATKGSPRKAAAWSAVAVGMVGGVNAVATAAVLPLGILWLVTRRPGKRSLSMLLWWPVFTFLATVWWMVPLFLMGAYSPPFLDYIETASITTFPTTITDALRGTSAWVPYLDASWRGGRQTITAGFLALNSGVVLMVGVIGLLMRANPHRLFLALSATCGLLLVTLGHQGSVEGWFAGGANQALDGVLAPMRNVHKFDPVIRLPLVLGLAWFLEIVSRSSTRITVPLRRGTLRLTSDAGYAAMVLVAVAGAAAPALSGGLAPSSPVLGTPSYWKAANQWLTARTEDGTTALLVPGSGFANYVWGAPRDEPLQYLAGSTWAVRNAIPLAPAGNIRMLDRIEKELQAGHGSPALTAYLRRAGVRYLVVRHDLAAEDTGPSSAQVHQALEDSAGISLAARFGPPSDSVVDLVTDEGRLLIEGGWRESWSPVEVFEVSRAGTAVASRDMPVVVGGPEDVLDVIGAGLVAGEVPVQLGYDWDLESAPERPVVLTDGLVDRERFFGRVHDATSAAITPGHQRRTDNPTRDYLPTPASGTIERWQTRARLEGLRSLAASSSGSDATAFGGARPAQLPFAAVDAAADTEWVSGLFEDDPAWWEARLDDPTSVAEVEVEIGDSSSEGITIRARTENGAGEAVDTVPGETTELPVPAGSTDWIRVEVPDQDNRRLALADVDWNGRGTVRRPLALPILPETWAPPDAVLLRSMLSGRSGCVEVDGRVPCVADEVVEPEEPNGFDRVVTLPRGASFGSTAVARPVGGEALDLLVQQGRLVNAQVSSHGVPDPRGGAFAVLDGDPGTAWTAALSDDRPELTLSWLGRRRISGLSLVVPSTAPVLRPAEVTVSWSGGSQTVDLDASGTAEIEPIRTDRVTLRLEQGDNAQIIDARGNHSPMPYGISEVRLDGLASGGPLDVLPRTLECGTGPDLIVNDVRWRTALHTSAARLYAGEPAELEACGGVGLTEVPVSMHAGENEIRSVASPVAVMESLLLTQGDDLPLGGIGVTDLNGGRGPGDPQAGDSVATMRHNVNDGWRATQDGVALAPTTVDGWQQAWRLRDTSAVVETFAPGRVYRWAVSLGLAVLACFIGVMALGALRPKRLARRRLREVAPALGALRVPSWVMAPFTVLACGVLAGTAGAALGAVGGLLAWALGRLTDERFESIAWLAGMPVLVALGAYFMRPWADSDGWAGALTWPHLVVVTVLGFVLMSAATRRPTRMPGSSTHR